MGMIWRQAGDSEVKSANKILTQIRHWKLWIEDDKRGTYA